MKIDMTAIDVAYASAIVTIIIIIVYHWWKHKKEK